MLWRAGDYVVVRSKTNDWFMGVTSEMNDPLKEVKVMFMRKSVQYLLLSKKLEKWFLIQQYFIDAPYHPLTSAFAIPLMP